MTYQRIRIIYQVRGKLMEKELSVLPETRELIIASNIAEIVSKHHITERDIIVQEVLL